MGSYQSLRKSIYQNLVQHAPNCRWKVLESIFGPTMRNTNRIPAKVTNTFIKVFTVSRFKKGVIVLLCSFEEFLKTWSYFEKVSKNLHNFIFANIFSHSAKNKAGNLISDELIVCTIGLNSFCAFLPIEKCQKTTLSLSLIKHIFWSRFLIQF